MHYADAIAKPPKTLTELEQRLLLKTSGEHRDGYRDHVIFSIALGTGLREHEILALNVDDVFGGDNKPKRRVTLSVFKRSNKDTDNQEVILPENLRAKLEKFLRWKKQAGEDISETAPLFVSRKGNRLSTRQLREMFGIWQERAGFDRHLNFHSTRHYADLRIMPHWAHRAEFSEENAALHAALSEAMKRLALTRKTSVIGCGPMPFARRRR